MRLSELTQRLTELRRIEREKDPMPDKLAEVGHAAAVTFLKSVPTNELSNYAVTMTDLPKVGVNPSSYYDTPIGIYFYPAEYYLKKVVRGKLPFQHNAAYIQILKFTTDQILYVGGITAADYERDVKKIQSLNLLSSLSPEDRNVIKKLHQESARKAKVKKPGGQLWYVTWKLSNLLEKKYHKESHTIWNWLLRQLGYKVVIDLGSKIIHYSEPTQGLILDSVGSYQWVKTIRNTNKEDVAFRQEFKKKFSQLDHQQKTEFVRSLEPTERVRYFAKYPQLIQFIKDPTIIDKLVGNGVTVKVIKYIKNPSEKLQELAVRTSPNAIKYIKNPSEEVKKRAVQSNGLVIQYLPNPSEELQLIAVNSVGEAIEHINNPSEDVQLAAVQQDGAVIQFINNPSEDVQWAAVQQNGYALEFINNPSDELQRAAVQQNGNALEFINNPSEELQRIAVQKNGWVIKKINNPSEDVQRAAVQQDGAVIQFIDNPSEDVQLDAVNQGWWAIQYIKKPTPKVKALAKKLKSSWWIIGNN